MDAVAEFNKIKALKIDAKKIVESHAPMVKRIAYHLKGRLPQSVMIEDLVQAGMIGLLDACNKFDDSKGATFETYAGIRIRGHMIDEVRRNDWVPRSVYKNSRIISQTVKKIENLTGRDARDSEVAHDLGISLSDYHLMLKDTTGNTLYGFEDLGMTDDLLISEKSNALSEPCREVQKDKFNRQLIGIIEKLPEREKLVLSLYYEKELNLKEIGQVLGVSESRVSQIHSQAMVRIKARIKE